MRGLQLGLEPSHQLLLVSLRLHPHWKEAGRTTHRILGHHLRNLFRMAASKLSSRPQHQEPVYRIARPGLKVICEVHKVLGGQLVVLDIAHVEDPDRVGAEGVGELELLPCCTVSMISSQEELEEAIWWRLFTHSLLD